MKTCPNCHEEVEDNFDLCWNCNYSFSDGTVVDIEVNEDENGHRKLNCLRCVDVKMVYAGVYRFHEGANFGIWDNMMELFNNKESFELYICQRCGKVEFFSPR